MLSGAALAVSLYALARFHLIATGTLGAGFSSTLLVVFGLLSLAVALPFIVAQGDLKRLLAYSSIEHLGLAVLALGFGGHLALLGLTLHLACHGLAKSTAFLSAGQLVAERGSRRIGRLGGSLARSPADGRALVVAAFVLAGLPPSGIFVAELAILFGGVAMGWGSAAALAALILALAVAGLLFHVVQIAVGPSRRRPAGDRGPLRASVARIVLLTVPLTLVAVAGLWTPSPLAAALEQVVLVLGGGGG
jgi:hydrogenase-4 component F